MVDNQVSFSTADEVEAPGYKYKCSVHKHYTNDLIIHQKHLMDPNISHKEIINNGTCFYCGERLDADINEGVETRHHFTGKATHKACRQKMYDEIVNGSL